jgi:hypothetical protein
VGLLDRLPTWQQTAQVYAIIVLVTYSWTILSFFWMFPSWRIILTAGEILGVLGYSLAAVLLESVLVMVVIVAVAVALPKTWFSDVFVARGAALVLAGLGYAMFLSEQLKTQGGFPKLGLPGWILIMPLVAIVLVVYLAGRIRLVRNFLGSLADRATIFLYVMTPLSVLSLLGVLTGLIR